MAIWRVAGEIPAAWYGASWDEVKTRISADTDRKKDAGAES